MKKHLLIACTMALLTHVEAQNVSFGKIQSPKNFQKYWGLTPQQMETYENYMQVAGKYRHQQTNPLTVLSIIAESPEDKEYFAGKAAKYEAQMVMRELETSWLMSSAMEKQGLSDKMSDFATQLTGIEASQGYKQSFDWQKGDDLVIIIDKVCVEMNCLHDFIPLLTSVPEGVSKTIITQFPKDPKIQTDYQTILNQLKTKLPSLNSANFDAIEHGDYSGLKNQAAQIRDGQIIRKL